MYDASGKAKKTATAPMSSTVPRRPRGIVRASFFIVSSLGARRRIPSVPAIGPGAMLLARMPYCPVDGEVFHQHVAPALAAPTWA